MSNLYYTVFDTDVCTVLLVLTLNGFVCYASLGKPAIELKGIMAKDFPVFAISTQTIIYNDG